MNHLSRSRSAMALAGVLTLGACAWVSSFMPADAKAEIGAASGSSVSGSASFRNTSAGILIEGTFAGLTPGLHGIHIHEVGDCSAPDASSAKGHFNPAGVAHGNSHEGTHHAGDLPNLVADASGNAHYSAEVPDLKIGAGSNGISGRALVVHMDADDYKTQPAGNSGKRVACGVIKPS